MKRKEFLATLLLILLLVFAASCSKMALAKITGVDAKIISMLW